MVCFHLMAKGQKVGAGEGSYSGPLDHPECVLPPPSGSLFSKFPHISPPSVPACRKTGGGEGGDSLLSDIIQQVDCPFTHTPLTSTWAHVTTGKSGKCRLQLCQLKMSE